MATFSPTAPKPAAAVAAAGPQKQHVIEPPFYPIVYVRGYAMTGSERDETFHDGYYGFAATSVRKRQGPPDPDRYLLADVFEGQLMRFVKDFGYADAINRGNRIEKPPRNTVFNPSRSLWISRFYDPDVLGQKLRSIEDHAQDLQRLICDIIPAELEASGMDLGGEKRTDYRVILLAHSMGGLVCRTLLQNLLPAAGEDPARWVHRFVTMATPHGGIDLGSLPDGVEQWVVDKLNPNDASIFQEKRMRDYLRLPDPAEPVNSLGGHFPVARCLCLIGSNYKDYAVGSNLVRRATGAFSDGLVKQNNAYLVDGPRPASGDYPPARRAFFANVHKSHSGYEGIVNSYESWENVHRFLFGDVGADIELANLTLDTAPPAAHERVFYDVEYSFSVRGTNTKMHWRAQFPCENALRFERPQLEGGPLRLHTAFLNTALRPELPAGADPAERDPREGERAVSRYLYFLLTLRVVEYRVQEASGALASFKHWIGVDSSYEGAPVYAETLEIRVEVASYAVSYRWYSDPASSGGWADAALTAQASGNDYSFPLRAGALRGDFVIHARRWSPLAAPATN